MRFKLNGVLHKAVEPKDVILYLIGQIKADGADYMSVEFTGPVVDEMSVSGRMVLCNMSMEMGAKNGVCFPDKKTMDYLERRIRQANVPGRLRQGGRRGKGASISTSPTWNRRWPARIQVDNVKPVSEVAGKTIDQAVIGSCTNGRLEDLMAAEAVLRGQKVSDSVRLIIVPASREVYLDAADKGILSSLVRSGAIVTNPGCGPCLGAHQGILAPGERCISTTNRNFQGRMGSPESEVYLASPATVAASALAGQDRRSQGGAEMRGKVWRYGDHVNTDLIIPGRYLDDYDPKNLAKHAMEDIDPTFAKKVRLRGHHRGRSQLRLRFQPGAGPGGAEGRRCRRGRRRQLRPDILPERHQHRTCQ